MLISILLNSNIVQNSAFKSTTFGVKLNFNEYFWSSTVQTHPYLGRRDFFLLQTTGRDRALLTNLAFKYSVSLHQRLTRSLQIQVRPAVEPRPCTMVYGVVVLSALILSSPSISVRTIVGTGPR
jgi:hypothetical protein